MSESSSRPALPAADNRIPTLFLTFFKIGLFTFGGGFAMIPIIEREIVEKRGWVDRKEVADIFAVAQSVPGAVAINSATFVGYKAAGRKGALAATAGVILPSLIVITIIAAFFSRFQENRIVRNAFSGIRACVTVLVAYAGVSLTRSAVTNKTGAVIFAAALAALVIFRIDAIAVIAAGIVVGIAGYLRKK